MLLAVPDTIKSTLLRVDHAFIAFLGSDTSAEGPYLVFRLLRV